MAYMVKLLKIPPAVINFHQDIRKIPSSGVGASCPFGAEGLRDFKAQRMEKSKGLAQSE
jgi:hypothetical protein